LRSTGIVRKIDELGRIVLPIEIRNQMGMENKDGIEIFVDENNIILKKYHPACIFCGNTNNVTYFKDKLVCEECQRILTHSI
jgi:transcriptional pleiotropic regulator of transition state genes